ncbi:MAG: hypothetical protein ACK4YP_09280, partial [Myxococcota bacterium]
MDLLVEPPLLDPAARDAEIAVLAALPERSSVEELRLADLELDAARAEVAERVVTMRALAGCAECPRPPKLGRERFDRAFSRYLALLDDDPDAPGLSDAVVRVAVPDAALWHGAGPHGEDLALARIDAWAGSWPESDAVTAALLLLYEKAMGWCHPRRLFESVAARLVGDPDTRRVLALEERLAPEPARLAGFHHWLGVYASLVEDAEAACAAESRDFRCLDPRIGEERAWIRAMKARAVPVYEAAARLDGYGAEEAHALFWILRDLGRREEAEAVARRTEERGDH